MDLKRFATRIRQVGAAVEDNAGKLVRKVALSVVRGAAIAEALGVALSELCGDVALAGPVEWWTERLVDLGQAADIYLVVQTQTAATDSGSDATLTVSLESDSTANLAAIWTWLG